MNRLEGALLWARNGRPVFPVGPDKRPKIKDWPNKASVDERQIRAWWERWPTANIGMPTGRRSGLLVVDADDRDTLRGLVAEFNGSFELTRGVRTPRGGRHLFYAYPAELEVRNSAGKLAPGIDVRGEGGYVIVPPSSGYSFGRGKTARVVRQLPDPWLDKLVGGAEDNGRALLAPGKRVVWTAGDRHPALARIAGSMRRQGCDTEAIEAALLMVNEEQCYPAKPVEEIRRLAEDIGAKDTETAGLELEAQAIVERREAVRLADKFDRELQVEKALSRAGVHKAVCKQVLERLDSLEEFDSPGVDRDDIDRMPDPSWMIDKCLPLGDYACMYGPPGVGKTFVAFSMCEAVTRGADWFGYPVRKGVSAYFSAEGFGQFKLRMRAYNWKYGAPGSNDDGAYRMVFWDQWFDIAQPKVLTHFVARIEDVRHSNNADFGLCVFDPTGFFRGGEPGEVENYESMALALKALATSLPEWSFLTVGHTNAGEDRQRGTDHLRMFAGAHIRVEHRRDREVGVVWEKARGAEAQALLLGLEPQSAPMRDGTTLDLGPTLVDMRGGEMTAARYVVERTEEREDTKAARSETAKRKRMDELKSRLLDALPAAAPGWTKQRLEQKVSGDDKRIRVALGELVEEEKVVDSGNGFHRAN